MFTADANNDIKDHANVGNHSLKEETTNGNQGGNGNGDDNMLVTTITGKSAMAVVTPPNVRDAIISHTIRICSARGGLILGHGRICFACGDDHHNWCVVPVLRCGVLICVMCSRYHERLACSQP